MRSASTEKGYCNKLHKTPTFFLIIALKTVDKRCEQAATSDKNHNMQPKTDFVRLKAHAMRKQKHLHHGNKFMQTENFLSDKTFIY